MCLPLLMLLRTIWVLSIAPIFISFLYRPCNTYLVALHFCCAHSWAGRREMTSDSMHASQMKAGNRKLLAWAFLVLKKPPQNQNANIGAEGSSRLLSHMYRALYRPPARYNSNEDRMPLIKNALERLKTKRSNGSIEDRGA